MTANKIAARRIAAVALAATLVAAATPARAESDYASDAGYGLLATVTNVFYMPAKILYAGVGGLIGGLAYLATAGDVETAQGVWSPAVGGDYVLTGSMLRGDDPIFFVGPTYRAPTERVPDDSLSWGREPMR